MQFSERKKITAICEDSVSIDSQSDCRDRCKNFNLIFTGNANQRAGSNALIHDVNINMHSFVTLSQR